MSSSRGEPTGAGALLLAPLRAEPQLLGLLARQRGVGAGGAACEKAGRAAAVSAAAVSAAVGVGQAFAVAGAVVGVGAAVGLRGRSPVQVPPLAWGRLREPFGLSAGRPGWSRMWRRVV